MMWTLALITGTRTIVPPSSLPQWNVRKIAQGVWLPENREDYPANRGGCFQAAVRMREIRQSGFDERVVSRRREIVLLYER